MYIGKCLNKIDDKKASGNGSLFIKAFVNIITSIQGIDATMKEQMLFRQPILPQVYRYPPMRKQDNNQQNWLPGICLKVPAYQ